MGTKYSQRGNKVFVAYKQSVCSLKTLLNKIETSRMWRLYLYMMQYLYRCRLQIKKLPMAMRMMRRVKM